MLDLDKVLALIGAMNEEGVEYITFGAVAMGVHALPRATEDADFFVRADSDNVDRLKRAIRRVWDDPEVENITYDDLAGDYPAIRYGPPDEDFTIDFVARLGEAFEYETLDWMVSELEGIPIRVVTPRMLYVMKKDTVRYKDRIDADKLRRKFALEE